MGEPKRHHYVPVFLLRAFASPSNDDGKLYVLDSARKKVFASRPSQCGFRRNFNRVDPDAHPAPLVVEEFYAKVESKVAPVIQRMLSRGSAPDAKAERDWIPVFVAMQMLRTPRFRRLLEGKHFAILETHLMKFAGSKASRRRFKQRQQAWGLPEECWSPEGFIARMRSGDFSITTDENWKIAVSNDTLLPIAKILELREWTLLSFDGDRDPMIIGDEGVGMFPLGPGGPVGVALRSTVVFLPISPHQVLVGFDRLARASVEKYVTPLLLNTTTFAWSLEQCYGSRDDFLIDDPDRGPTLWSTFQAEGRFPKLVDDAGDLADVYKGGPADDVGP